MKINLIYITLVQTIFTIFLLAVGFASQFVYQKFGGEENSSQDPEVAGIPVPDVVGFGFWALVWVGVWVLGSLRK